MVTVQQFIDITGQEKPQNIEGQIDRWILKYNKVTDNMPVWIGIEGRLSNKKRYEIVKKYNEEGGWDCIRSGIEKDNETGNYFTYFEFDYSKEVSYE